MDINNLYRLSSESKFLYRELFIVTLTKEGRIYKTKPTGYYCPAEKSILFLTYFNTRGCFLLAKAPTVFSPFPPYKIVDSPENLEVLLKLMLGILQYYSEGKQHLLKGL